MAKKILDFILKKEQKSDCVDEEETYDHCDRALDYSLTTVEQHEVSRFDLSHRTDFYRNKKNMTSLGHDGDDDDVDEVGDKNHNHVGLIPVRRPRNKKTVEAVAEYCLPLVNLEFHGQSSKLIIARKICTGVKSIKSYDAETSESKNYKVNEHDHCDDGSILNLGLYLSLLDKVIRKYKTVTEFTIDDEEYLLVLQLVASKRRTNQESTTECFEKLKEQSKIFQDIYHTRGVRSEHLHTKEFWGTRQQLLCGKVIVDWINTETHQSIDPIFGVLLCPCGGRVGPGDSGWVHSLLYDQDGYMAYHSAVHDAFGYLLTYHSVGPGYDYLQKSSLPKNNPLSGQYNGIAFWKNVLLQKKSQKMIVDGTLLIMFSAGQHIYTQHV